MRKREFKTCYENRIFKTKNFGDVIVTKYIDSYNVHVKFLDTKQVANKWKGVLDTKVYVALMNYQVEITD